MEASALHAPVPLLRFTAPLLKLRSDEQLVALFRAGSEDAFAVIHERYKQRLFAYCRQMLNGPRQDAEDVLQDVFVRAYSALRNDDRQVNLRAWLYRVAHNRCIDQLRRPAPPEREIFEVSRTPLHDPIIEAQRREDLRKLVADVALLPEQQRSALLMREIDGLSYLDLADALGVTVPAVKSLLVRARVGLAEAAEARDMDCHTIREDLALAADRGVRMSGRARRHLRECAGCKDYKVALRGVRTSFAAMAPAAGFGPLALLAKLGLGGGATGGGAAAAGGGVALGTVSAAKVAAVVAAAAVATGGAVEVKRFAVDDGPSRAAAERERRSVRAGGEKAAATAVGAQATVAAGAAAAAVVTPAIERPAAVVPAAERRDRRASRKRRAAATGTDERAVTPKTPATAVDADIAPAGGAPVLGSGAPSTGDAANGVTATPAAGAIRGGTAAGSGSGSGSDSGSSSTSSDSAAGTGSSGSAGASEAPPGEAPPRSGTSTAPPGSEPDGAAS